MTMSKFPGYFSTTITLLVIFLLVPGFSYAQYQENIPKPSGPIDLSDTSNQIIFIVIPLVILILYLVFRRRIRKVKKDKRERMEGEK